MRIGVVLALFWAIVPPNDAAAQDWIAPRTLYPSSEWTRPIVPREIDVSAGPTDVNKWVALYTPSDFNKLRNLTKAPCESGTCGSRVLHTLRTDADVEAFKARVLPRDQSALLPFATSLAFNAMHWSVGILEALWDLVNETQMGGGYSARAADFGSVIARGGEVRYSETLRGSGPYTLERVIFYRINVGDEVRIFPLWLSRIRAEIDGPEKPEPVKPAAEPPKQPEVKEIDSAPAPKHADCVAWKEFLQHPQGWKITAGAESKTLIWKWGVDGNLVTTSDGKVSNPAGYRLRTDPRATNTGCMIQIIGVGNAFIDGYEGGQLTISVDGRSYRMQKYKPE